MGISGLRLCAGRWIILGFFALCPLQSSLGQPLHLAFETSATLSSATRIENLDVRWTRLDFLLSHLSLRKSDGNWLSIKGWTEYLSLCGDRATIHIDNIPAGKYTHLKFAVGVDPATNNSNPFQYPPEHPLNPNLNNLHWGWQGGYIFAALEGHFRPSNSDNGMSWTGFSYHVGGDGNEVWVELPFPDAPEFSDASGRRAPPIHFKCQVEPEIIFAAASGIDAMSGNTSTHSRDGDPVLTSLRAILPHAFQLFPATEIERGMDSPSHFPTGGSALTRGAPSEGAARTFIRIPDHFPKPSLSPDNPLTVEGVELGRRLFHDPILSGDNSQACLDCHRPQAAFTDPEKIFSIGIDGKSGRRNAMPLFNLAWASDFFWDGRAPDLRTQVLMPIQDPLEMHADLNQVVSKLSAIPEYRNAFSNAFLDGRVSAHNIALALEQFLMTLVSADSRFDSAMKGKTQLSDQERKGLQLFVTEYDPSKNLYGADCFHCHGGPLFTNHQFANNGLPPKGEGNRIDLGRGEVTGVPADSGQFKVPSLRNVELTAPYMHDGRFATLEQVVDHYNSGVYRSDTLDPNLAKHPDTGLRLSDADKAALVAFMKTLTDPAYSGNPSGDTKSSPARDVARATEPITIQSP